MNFTTESDKVDSKDYLELYTSVCTSGYLINLFRYRKKIKVANACVVKYVNENQMTDIRKSCLTLYIEKINTVYQQKSHHFWSSVINTAMVVGTFAAALIAYISMQKH